MFRKSRIEIRAGRKHIDLSGRFAAGEKVLEIGHILPLPFGHIIDVGNIGVELRAEAEKCENDSQHKRNPDQTAVILRRKPGHGIQKTAFATGLLPRPDKVRKVEQHEKYGAQKQKGGKNAEMPQSSGLERHQGKEGADRGDIAHQQRHKDFLHGLTHIPLMLRMGYQM